MMLDRVSNALRIEIEDGCAHRMGNGVLVLMQRDGAAGDRERSMLSVVVSATDLTALRTPTLDRVSLGDDAGGWYLGDGLWIIEQMDERFNEMQRIVVSNDDIEALIAA